MDLSGIDQECEVRIGIKEDERIERFHTIVWGALEEKPELNISDWKFIIPSILENIHQRWKKRRKFWHGEKASSDDEIEVIEEDQRENIIVETTSYATKIETATSDRIPGATLVIDYNERATMSKGHQ